MIFAVCHHCGILRYYTCKHYIYIKDLHSHQMVTLYPFWTYPFLSMSYILGKVSWLYITVSENLQNWTSHPLLNFLIRTMQSLSSTLTSLGLLEEKVTPSLEVMSQIALLILSWSPDCGNCGEQDSSENNLWKVIVNILPHLPLFYFILFVNLTFLLEQAKIKKIELSCLIGPQCSCHIDYITFWVLSIIRDIRAVILYVQD